MQSARAIIKDNGGPRSVVAETSVRTRQSASLHCGSVSTGGPRSVVAAPLPARKAPAHHPILSIDNRSPIVFLTVCSHDKRPIFDKPDIHELMQSVWGAAGAWHIGRYVLMPDHIHLFCAPNGLDAPSLSKWVHFWKSAASRPWPRPEEQPVWQKSFWDTQLRRSESYGEKWEYVRHNPMRANLCVDSTEWPFQGEMNILMWHE